MVPVQRPGLSVYAHSECGATFCLQCFLDYARERLGELICLIPKSQIRPTRFEKENSVSRFLPRADFMRIAADADISGNNDPFLFRSEGLHPYRVLLISCELVL